MPNFENSRWRTTAILKMILSLYLSRESFWYADPNSGSKNGNMLIYKKKYEIQNGGQPPYWKSSFLLYLYELLSDWRDIWYVQVEPCSDTRHVTKILIFENSTWRTAAIFENGFITISQPRIIRFQWNLVCHCRFWFQGWSKYCKFNMADGRHIENRFLAISQRFIVRLTRNLIWRNRIRFR